MNESSTTAPRVDTRSLAAGVKQRAREVGFDRVGITPAIPSQRRDYFRQWLDGGAAGLMSYLQRRLDERTDPTTYFPGAKSIICLAVSYFVPTDDGPPSENTGRIARYALGDDYHEIIKPKLHALADWLRAQVPEAQTRCAVDTAPVMEKELAARAGIGWQGKNTCIINEQSGSWLFLAEVLTTIELPSDEPATDRCGACTRCIDACPTAAITEPYHLDASRCISYLNIEHREEISADLAGKMGDWLYGCDICQEVCPWNRKPLSSSWPEFAPRFPDAALDLHDVAQWTPLDYQRILKGSAMKRVKLPVLQRNAQLIAHNSIAP
jgi:epoxyqueuosine reductase